MLVIAKPAGLVVHPGAGHADGTLVNGLLARLPGDRARRRPGASRHRAPARPRHERRCSWSPARRAPTTSSSAMLAAHEVERDYLALVWGHLDSPRGVIDAPIGRSVRRPTRMAVREGGRTARTAYVVRAAYRGPGRRRCSRARSRPVAPTRSGCTSRPSAIRWWATPATAVPVRGSTSTARSSTRPRWRSPTRSPGSASSSRNRSRPSSPRSWTTSLSARSLRAGIPARGRRSLASNSLAPLGSSPHVRRGRPSCWRLGDGSGRRKCEL